MKLSISDKLIVGTHINIDNGIVYETIARGLYFHTSSDYPGYQTFYKTANSIKKKVNLLVKIKSQDLISFKKQIKTYHKDFKNINKLSVQISRMCFPQDKNQRAIYFNYLRKLKEKGIIHEIYLEIYWEYSSKIISLIKEIKFDGFCICYNIIEREVSNKLFNLLKKNNYKIISLRGLSGNNLGKDNKSFLNISYLKFIIIIFFISILKKIEKKNLTKLSLEFLIMSKDIYKTVILTTKKDHFLDLMKYSIKKKKSYIVSAVNFFHNFIWRFSGANSPSSNKFEIGLYTRVENFLIKKIINIVSIVFNAIEISVFLITKKNILFVNSSLQILNFCELLKKKKIDISKTTILYGWGPVKYINRLKLVNIMSIFKIKKYRLTEIMIGEKLFFFILLAIIFIKKFEYIIVGNIFSDISNHLLKLRSRYKYILDDGTSTLYIDKFLKFDTIKSKILDVISSKCKNLFLFTYFHLKNSKFKVKNNDFSYLRNNFLLNNKIIGNYVLILGNAYHNKNILSKKSYYEIILDIKKKFYNKNFKFIKHPLEFDNKDLDAFLIKNDIELVNQSVYPAEIQVLLFKELPKYIISLNSSSLFSLSKILKKFDNIKIFNLIIDHKLLINCKKKIKIISRYKPSRVKSIKI
jgi:hypothetical protein